MLGMAMPSFLLRNTHGQMTSAVTMPSSPLDCTHDQVTSSMACHHSSWKAYTIGRRRAWYINITLGQRTRSNDLGHHIQSDAIGVAGRHRPWTSYARLDNVGHSMQSLPLDIIHGWTKSGVTSHHLPWKVSKIGRRRP